MQRRRIKKKQTELQEKPLKTKFIFVKHKWCMKRRKLFHTPFYLTPNLIPVNIPKAI